MSAACRNHSFISSLFVTLIMWVSENVTYTDLTIVKMNVVVIVSQVTYFIKKYHTNVSWLLKEQ